MHSRPQVSVVIPTRDRWPFLRAALATALNQTDVQLEVVVIDDASSDETSERLATIDDRRVQVVRHAENSGVARARNDGIDRARGEWIAFLDDDDLWAPDKTAAQLDAAERRDAVIVWSGAVVVDERRRVLRAMRAPGAEDIAVTLFGGNWIGSPSGVLARATAIRDVGGFDERLAVLADWDLWLRLSVEGAGAACPELHVAYAEHPANMHATNMDVVAAEFRYLSRKHAQLARDRGADFGSLWWSRWVAAGYRRNGRRMKAARSYARTWIDYRERRDLRFALGVLLGERLAKLGSDFPDEAAGLAPPAWLESMTTEAA